MSKYILKDYSTAKEALQIINNRPESFVPLIIYLDLENAEKSLQVLRELNHPISRLCLGNGPFTRGEIQPNEDQFSQDIMQAISNLPVSELDLSVSFLCRRSEESRQQFMESIPNNITYLGFTDMYYLDKTLVHLPKHLQSLVFANTRHFSRVESMRAFFTDFSWLPYLKIGVITEGLLEGLSTAAIRHISFESTVSPTLLINIDKYLPNEARTITLTLYYSSEDRSETKIFSRQELSFRAKEQECLNKLAKRREFFSMKGQTENICAKLDELKTFLEETQPQDFNLEQWSHEIRDLIAQRPTGRSLNKFKETTKAKMYRYIGEIITLTLNISILENPQRKPANNLKKEEPENELPGHAVMS